MFTVIITRMNGTVREYEHFDSYDRARKFADHEIMADDYVMRANVVVE